MAGCSAFRSHIIICCLQVYLLRRTAKLCEANVMQWNVKPLKPQWKLHPATCCPVCCHGPDLVSLFCHSLAKPQFHWNIGVQDLSIEGPWWCRRRVIRGKHSGCLVSLVMFCPHLFRSCGSNWTCMDSGGWWLAGAMKNLVQDVGRIIATSIPASSSGFLCYSRYLFQKSPVLCGAFANL